LLKKENKFKWDDKCEEAFDAIKMALLSTPIFEDAVNSTLAQEEEEKLIYFTRWTLQDTETRYQVIEKAALTLV